MQQFQRILAAEEKKSAEPPKDPKLEMRDQFQRILAAEEKKRSEASDESTKPKPPKSARVDDDNSIAEAQPVKLVRTKSQEKADEMDANELGGAVLSSSLTKSNDAIVVPPELGEPASCKSSSSSLAADLDEKMGDDDDDDNDKPCESDDAMKDDSTAKP